MADVYITDSCSDLTAEYASGRNLLLLPMPCMISGVECVGPKGSIDTLEFYRRLRAGEMAVTSQLTAYSLAQFLRPFLQKGDDVFYLTLSSGMSGTYEQALSAKEQLEAEFPDRSVLVLDSLGASGGQGMLVHIALDLRDSGLAAADVFARMEKARAEQCLWFTVDDLEFLYRGGRIKRSQAILGGMMRIKPVLHVDEKGFMVNMFKARGRQKALAALVEKMEETCLEKERPLVFINHGDCAEDAETVRGLVLSRFPNAQIHMGLIGPTVGCHSGPGTVALFFRGSRK